MIGKLIALLDGVHALSDTVQKLFHSIGSADYAFTGNPIQQRKYNGIVPQVVLGRSDSIIQPIEFYGKKQQTGRLAVGFR